jgi:membrane protease YdiL (CAAX protease family)
MKEGKIANLISRYPLIAFSIVAYVWSWLIWSPVVLALLNGPKSRPGLLSIPWWATVGALAGGYGPTVSALLLTALQRGAPGVRKLVARLGAWRVGLRWYLVALFLPSVLLGVAIPLAKFRGSVIPPITLRRAYLMLPALIAAFPFGPLGEELGWRGFLLPRLQRERSALSSSLVIGIVSMAWHLPLFWAPAGTTISGSPVTAVALLRFLIECVSFAVLLTWLFNSTDGSVLLTVILHAAWNQPLVTFLFSKWPEDTIHTVSELILLPLCLAAAFVICWFGPRRLARGRLAQKS